MTEYLPHPQARITAYSKQHIFVDSLGETHKGYVMYEMIDKEGNQSFHTHPMSLFLRTVLK